MAKATTHQTSTPTNLNIRTRSSTLYANAPILVASILLNFRRRPESHLQLQVSEKFRSYRSSGGKNLSRKIQHPAGHSVTPELLQLLTSRLLSVFTTGLLSNLR